MELVQFISDAIQQHNTSIGKNKALPNGDAFLYDVINNRFIDVVNNLQNQIGYIPTPQEAENLLNKLMHKAIEIEKPLRPQLEKLCEAVVNAVLGIPQETIILECKLVDKIEPYTELRVLPEEDEYTFEDDVEFNANDEILKRRFVNSLVQGVSYWLMYDTIEADALEKWSDELMPLYDQIISLNDYLIYTKEEHISDKNPMLGALVETHLGKGKEKTVIESQGLIYPLLLQETYRGMFELYGSHGLPQDSKKANYILHQADFLMAEAWDLRIGSALWECVEKCTSKKPLNNVYPYLFSSLVQLSTNKFNELTRQILTHTDTGKEWIQEIVKQVVHDEEYQLFKQDIKNFNLDKCVINDNERDKDILGENIINELFNLDSRTITSCRKLYGHKATNEALRNISNYLEPVNEELRSRNFKKARKMLSEIKILPSNSIFNDIVLNELIKAQKEKINLCFALNENNELNKTFLIENKYDQAFNDAVNQLEAFKKKGQKKYNCDWWYESNWMKIHRPDIQIDPQDIETYQSLLAKEKEINHLWNLADDEEENAQHEAKQQWASEQTNLINLAIKEFGITSRLSQAGYILPDGKLLNFGEAGDRGTDHRAIESIYIKNNIKIWNDEYRYNYVVDFLNHGAIRIDANTGLIDMTMEPTSAEYSVLKQLVRATGGEAYMDFTDKEGNTEYSVEYDHVTGQRLVADIRKYYQEGLRPQGDMCESKKKKHVLKEGENTQKQKLNTVVVDSNGNPIKCYHSTPAKFNSFDPNKINSGGAGCYHGFGFNFTTQPNTTYGGNVIEAYLTAKKPLWDKKKTIGLSKLIKILIALDKGEQDSIVCNFTGNNPKIGGQGYFYEIQKTAEEILDYAEGDLDIYANICTAANCGVQKVIDTFSKLGYDSAIETYDDGRLRVVVVFHPEQINIVSEPLVKENKNLIKEFKCQPDKLYTYCGDFTKATVRDILTHGLRINDNGEQNGVWFSRGHLFYGEQKTGLLFSLPINEEIFNICGFNKYDWENKADVIVAHKDVPIELLTLESCPIGHTMYKGEFRGYMPSTRDNKRFDNITFEDCSTWMKDFDYVIYEDLYEYLFGEPIDEHEKELIINNLSNFKFINFTQRDINEEILYHTSNRTQEEDERTGIWLSNEPDEAYGQNIYEYDIDLNSLNIANQYTVEAYVDKYGERDIEEAKMREGIDEDDDYVPYDEIMTQPWYSDWNRYLQEDGYDGYQFNYDDYQYWYIYDPKNAKRITESKQINEYLDKDYMKPLFDYLRNGERYSSGGYYNASERLVVPFFEWARTKLDENDWNKFAIALRNCKQLKGKVQPSNFMGHHTIVCYSQMSNGMKEVRTNDFLRQNAKHIFNITYNQDPVLSLFWDKFVTQFINTKEGDILLSNSKSLDADTVLMNPELKKPQWLIHLTPNKNNALNIVQNGFQYGLDKNQMSKLGYTNNGIDKESKKGKYLYAYNAKEIATGTFPTNFMVKDKSQHKYDKPFDQKTWEYASNFAIMFTAPGIQAFHGTDKQNQVIFASDTAHNYVLLTRGNNFIWQVNTTNGKVAYKNNSLTNVVAWVINNFGQYRKQICWKK